jgi:hypothetical protein
MSDFGIRSGMVRAGFYRCGSYCIHKGRGGWGVYLGPAFKQNFKKLSDAYYWCRRQPAT